jgi:hypothetical protein
VLAPGQLPEWTILSTRSTIKAEIQEIGISSWRPPKGKGSQWLELDGDENGPGKKWDATAMGRAEEGLYAIRQTLVVEPGKPYALMFDFAARPGTKQIENEMRFSVLGMDDKPLKHAGGADVAGVILAAPHQIVAKSTPPVWQTATEIFVAPASGQVKIEFEGLGPNNTYGMFLDNVVVVPVPVSVDLDTDSNNDGVIDPNNNAAGGTDDPVEEQSPGRIVFVNADDDDKNGIADSMDQQPVAGENDLAELLLTTVSYWGSSLGDPVVSYDDNVVRLYAGADRSAPITSGSAIASNGTLYAEGLATGTSLVTVTLSTNGMTFTDTVRLTVIPFPGSIDVDIDSDNNQNFDQPAQSEWEEILEDHAYAIGKLIMLDNPQRTVTPIVLDVPAGLPDNAPAVGVRIDWDVVGRAGEVRLWNTFVIDDLRNPAAVDEGGDRIFPGFTYTLADLNYDAEAGRIVIYAEGVKENEVLKTLAGVESVPKVDERIRGTLVVNGDDVAFDEVKYMVANEDSFYYALHTRQEVRNELASRGVYTFDDLPKFSLEPKDPVGLGVDPNVAGNLGKNPQVAGLKAMIYQDYITGEDQYVLSFGGTDDKIWELEFNDWLNNIKQGLGWSAPQYTAAMAIGDELGDLLGQAHLIVTGHSLGGGLAAAAALVANVRADTFNAAGLHEYTLYDRDQNDAPLLDPAGEYVELYPGAAARYPAAGNFINAYYVDYDILTFVQGFIGRTAIGIPHELDGPKDLELALYVAAFGTAVAARSPWEAAAAVLGAIDIMVGLHSHPSILHGLLVTEGILSAQVDMLGYDL